MDLKVGKTQENLCCEMKPLFLTTITSLIGTVLGFVHPIAIHGRYFIDSVTREPFFVKGVDYQPGGSAAVSEYQDPLSDRDICARDVILFQDLGINTVRVYSVNPDLNHDYCMTLFASAGIYLMLDVNSPLPNQHLNRYEPWTTYNENYLEHVFKIVDQFSAYNNTLGFFSGNEIVNDRKSARNSPVFIKRLISDMKRYIANHSDRIVPVGYSAADDLNYRISLSKYLECCDDATISDAVDFYGVNTYQWCGEQTFYTSGYDILVRDYENYVRPVFFSEFGCNLVSPRTFEEIGAMYSDDMVGVFSGGLVYEFSEEQNKYGLVFINEKGNVRLLEDYDALKIQYSAVEYPTGRQISDLYSRNGKKQQLGAQALPVCELEYDNIEISGIVEHSISELLLKNGVDVKKGKFVKLKNEDLYTTYNISNSDGTPFERNKFVKVVNLVHGITEYEALKLQQLQNEGKYPIHIEAGPEYHVNTIMNLIAEC